MAFWKNILCKFPSNLKARKSVMILPKQYGLRVILTLHSCCLEEHTSDLSLEVLSLPESTPISGHLSRNLRMASSFCVILHFIEQINRLSLRRRRRLKIHTDCFKGSDAVDWLMQNAPYTERREAAKKAVEMQEKGLIQSVAFGSPFSDKSKELYRYVLAWCKCLERRTHILKSKNGRNRKKRPIHAFSAFMRIVQVHLQRRYFAFQINAVQCQTQKIPLTTDQSNQNKLSTHKVSPNLPRLKI